MFTLILCACIEYIILHKSILFHVTLNYYKSHFVTLKINQFIFKQ